jgi:hypothetical protein
MRKEANFDLKLNFHVEDVVEVDVEVSACAVHAF